MNSGDRDLDSGDFNWDSSTLTMHQKVVTLIQEAGTASAVRVILILARAGPSLLSVL